jgi:hypothetical protein
MRGFAALFGVGVAVLAAAPSAWSTPPTLRADHRVTRFDDSVRFRGALATPEPQQVVLLRDGVAVASVVATGGAFAFDQRLRAPGTFVARTVLGDSAPVLVRMSPRLRARIVGRRVVGHRVTLVGRMLPARAGRLLLGRRRVAVAADGRFRARVPTTRGPRVSSRLRLVPATGYVTVRRRVLLRLAQPLLRMGSHGPAVLVLKQRLRRERYALPSVDAGFGYLTYEAVLAFQKVHRLPRTGQVGRDFWRLLWRASAPRPRRGGDYLEVDKSRQVLFEVRKGRVVNVVHVSTGVTGNTPLGTWRVYSAIAGWSWVLWQPMYFLRGFAIHGYPSVPAWPASHGCVRVPMWLATSLRERWGYGSVVRVYQ